MTVQSRLHTPVLAAKAYDGCMSPVSLPDTLVLLMSMQLLHVELISLTKANSLLRFRPQGPTIFHNFLLVNTTNCGNTDAHRNSTRLGNESQKAGSFALLLQIHCDMNVATSCLVHISFIHAQNRMESLTSTADPCSMPSFGINTATPSTPPLRAAASSLTSPPFPCRPTTLNREGLESSPAGAA